MTALFPGLVLALAVTPCSAGEASLRQSRRLMYGELDESYMWGKCDAWTQDIMGCNLTNGLTCSSFLSDGPEDGDLEVTLSSLPPSTEDEEVHLQWWAPRKSVYPYDPWESPRGVAVYCNMLKAYPDFNSEDYNGGNVRVNSSGVATLRVHAPATYVLDQWILYPHIHFRLCRGNSFVNAGSDAIYFTHEGARVVSGRSGHTHLMEHTTAAVTEAPTATSTAIWDGPTSTTVSITDTSTSTRLATITSTETATFTSTSTSEDDGLLDNTTSYVDLRTQDAMEALDLDALEFSPVYHCLLQGTFYSYFSGGCVDECPADAEDEVGQCVREEIADTPATLEATWSLRLECLGPQGSCFHNKLTVTLHNIRLAVADHLDIPFQEVVDVSLTQHTIEDRRLSSDQTDLQLARLYVRVESQRVRASVDGPYLGRMVSQASDASFLTGFAVYSVELVSDGSGGGDMAIARLNRDNDPYEEAYTRATPKNKGVRIPGVMSDTLPVEAVFVGAGLVLLTLSTFAACMFIRRRRNGKPIVIAGFVILGPSKMPAADPKTMEKAKQAEDEDEDDLKKPNQDMLSQAPFEEEIPKSMPEIAKPQLMKHDAPPVGEDEAEAVAFEDLSSAAVYATKV